jgi:fibronectin type 3 domain-containing protein
MTLTILLAFLPVSACGRKGPPTLKAYEKPQAPQGLSAIHREDQIILSWSYPENLRVELKGFEVLRAEDGGFQRIGSAGNDESSFIDRTFRADVTYRYKVVARNPKGILSDDSDIIAFTPRQIPPVPENLRFTVGVEGIELSWKSSGEGVCYNIYKTAEKGKYAGVPLNREPECSNFFRDAATSPDRAVYYTVRALHKTAIRDEGYASEEIEVSPSHFVPSPPVDLRVVRGEDKVHLIWKESPETWVKGYRVYRRKQGEEAFTFLGKAAIPSFTDTEKIEGKAWYMIKALGPVKESGPLIGE